MDDLALAASFWGVNTSSVFKMKLKNSKDLSLFQTSQDIPHTTFITVNKNKFRVNSLILAQHSDIFEKMIWSGDTDISITNSLSYEHMDDAVYMAILFLHGKEINCAMM